MGQLSFEDFILTVARERLCNIPLAYNKFEYEFAGGSSLSLRMSFMSLVGDYQIAIALGGFNSITNQAIEKVDEWLEAHGPEPIAPLELKEHCQKNLESPPLDGYPELEHVRPALEQTPGAFERFTRFYIGTGEPASALLESTRHQLRTQITMASMSGEVRTIKNHIETLAYEWLLEDKGAAPAFPENQPTRKTTSKAPAAGQPGDESSSTGGSPSPPALSRHRAQELAMVAGIKKAGYDPQALPKAPPGKKGPKAEIRQALQGTKPLNTKSIFDKTWERLRESDELRDK